MKKGKPRPAITLALHGLLLSLQLPRYRLQAQMVSTLRDVTPVASLNSREVPPPSSHRSSCHVPWRGRLTLISTSLAQDGDKNDTMRWQLDSTSSNGEGGIIRRIDISGSSELGGRAS